MPVPNIVVHRIAILAHPQIPEAITEAAEIAAFLQDAGQQVTYGLLNDERIRQMVESKAVDLVIALGGDGTMLRAGHLCGPHNIPILGINLGRFGFLMEIRKNQWKEALLNWTQGSYWLEKRMMLITEQKRDGETKGKWDVVNEAVVSRGTFVRPVHLDTSVDGRFLATYVADGLIASTPTGSTAYALAVGGPILAPELRNIVLVPIAPHLSIDRAIVIAEGSSVSIIVNTSHQAVLSIDGQPPIELRNGDCIEVYASSYTLNFVRFQDPGYFYRNLTPHMNRNPSLGANR
jgi:NAD+ kinase